MKYSTLINSLSGATACLSSLECKRKQAKRNRGKTGITACSGLSLILILSISTGAQALKPNNSSLQAQLQIRPSVNEIARQINQQSQWRVLEAGPTVEDKKILYRFKLLDKERGSVKVFIIDPTDPLFKNLHLGKQ